MRGSPHVKIVAHIVLSATICVAFKTYNLQGHTVSGVCPGAFPQPPLSRLHELRLAEGCNKRMCNESTWNNLPMEDVSLLFEEPFYLARLEQVALLEDPLLLQGHKQRPAYDITIVTQFSLPRCVLGGTQQLHTAAYQHPTQRPTSLRNVARQCKEWPGSISAALYIPQVRYANASVLIPPDHLVKLPAVSHNAMATTVSYTQPPSWTLQEALAYVKQQHAAIAAQGACQFRLVVYTELLDEATSTDETLRLLWSMPINAMRNKALLHAPSEVVMYADGDFVPGPVGALKALLHRGTGVVHTVWHGGSGGGSNATDGEVRVAAYGYTEMVADLKKGNIVVVPALLSLAETVQGQLQALEAAVHTTSKQQLAALITREIIIGYTWYHEHTKVNATWVNATEPYATSYSCHEADGVDGNHYEPYFIALRDAIPLADERYRGYWANKIAWLDDIRAAGFDHVVHPDMFLMHAPHTHTSTDMYNGRVRFSYIKHRLLYDNCQRSLPYYPVVLVDDAAFCGAR